MEELRMAAKARISEAGMLKAAWLNGQQEGHKEGHKEEQARMLALIEEGYTLEQIKAILRTGQDDRQFPE
ncbi:MAG: hypothetical protein LBJ99_01105 [Oscillospiraceae bacterium]|jgi:hypothetical protein|nr:hypothetical protein [Oscillospiraceae bacterium]